MKRLLLAGLLAAFTLVPARADEKAEQAILKNFTTRQKEIAAKIVATSDLDQRRTLMGEQEKLLQETLGKLTEPNRSTFAVVVRIVNPIQQDGAAYLGRVGELSSAATFDFSTITKKEDIAARREKLDELLTSNAQLLQRLNRITEDVEKELALSNLSTRQRNEFMAGFNKGFGRMVGPSRAIRTLDAIVWGKLKEQLKLLEDHWGEWETKDGQILWSNDAVLETYNKLAQEVTESAARQSAAEQELARRM